MTDAGEDPTRAGGLPRGARVGVDVGSVRVGLAASDPDGVMATPVETVLRDTAGWQRLDRGGVGRPPADVTRIAAEVAERSAAVVYVGLPRHLSGVEGAASQAVRVYAGALASAVAPVPVRLVDERMSTVSAHQALHASGRSGRRHRQVVDQAAAVVILQSALDAERAAGARAGEPVRAGTGPAATQGSQTQGSRTQGSQRAADDGTTTER